MQQYLPPQRNLVYTGVTRGQEAGGGRRPAEGDGDDGEEQQDEEQVFRAAGAVVRARPMPPNDFGSAKGEQAPTGS
jgi:hypothetical protein